MDFTMPKQTADRLISKAEVQAKKRNLKDAERLYNEVLQNYPGNVRARKGLAALRAMVSGSQGNEGPDAEYKNLLSLFEGRDYRAAIDDTQRPPGFGTYWVRPRLRLET